MNKKTGYERMENGGIHWYVNEDGDIMHDIEDGHEVDDNYFNIANYYSDETVAKNNARADKLMRQLRRFAVEHNECESNWNDDNHGNWFIYYAYTNASLKVTETIFCRDFGQIYFSSKEIAEKAIERYKDELLWYFTEYCDHVVEKDKKTDGCEFCNKYNYHAFGIVLDETDGENSKPKIIIEQHLEYCPKCGKKLVSE